MEGFLALHRRCSRSPTVLVWIGVNVGPSERGLYFVRMLPKDYESNLSRQFINFFSEFGWNIMRYANR